MRRFWVLGVALPGCIATGSTGLGRAQAGTHAISIAEFRYSPAELTISRGDTLVWTNLDSFLHTTTADSGAWGSAELARGARFVHVASRAGRYRYHCTAHPVMQALVVVRE